MSKKCLASKLLILVMFAAMQRLKKNPCLRKVIGLQDSTGDFNLSTDDYIGRAVQMN